MSLTDSAVLNNEISELRAENINLKGDIEWLQSQILKLQDELDRMRTAYPKISPISIFEKMQQEDPHVFG